MAGAGRAAAGGWQSLSWRDTGLAVPADAGGYWRSCWAGSGEGYEADGVSGGLTYHNRDTAISSSKLLLIVPS